MAEEKRVQFTEDRIPSEGIETAVDELVERRAMHLAEHALRRRELRAAHVRQDLR